MQESGGLTPGGGENAFSAYGARLGAKALMAATAARMMTSAFVA